MNKVLINNLVLIGLGCNRSCQGRLSIAGTLCNPKGTRHTLFAQIAGRGGGSLHVVNFQGIKPLK